MVIDKIYVNQKVKNSPLARRVLEKLRKIPVENVLDEEAFLEKSRRLPLHLAKRVLWLTETPGKLVKPCPGTGREYLCCNYWVINAQTNCPLDCTYCVLQGYLNQPVITLYTNLEKVREEIDSLLLEHPGRLFRLGTGELTDSLALNPLTEMNGELIEWLSPKKVILELKTKTDFVGHLPALRKRNVVVSWSLNPPSVIQGEEFKSAPLAERLDAARRAIAKGYRVGFHFDPILDIPDWEDQYSKLLTELCRAVPEKEVAWISMGSLRFPPALKEVIEERFPRTQITTGEMVRGLDGKLRYFRPLRTAMYQRIYSFIRTQWKEVFVYFCMESQTVWQEVFGSQPEDNDHLDYLFHESLDRRFPDLSIAPPNRKDYFSPVTSVTA